jgi:hypothetical protein
LSITEKRKDTCGFDFFELQKDLFHTLKEEGYDFSLLQEFNSKCFSLASSVDEDEAKDLFKKISEKVWYNLLNALDVLELLNDATKLTPKQKSLISLYFYINLVEGTISEQIQIISFMLIRSGKKIYDCRRKRFAKTYTDLERIDLKAKIEFINVNGFHFASREIDRNLRNCIAHQDFIIFDDGTVKNLRTGQQIDIEKKLRSICLTNSLVSMALKQMLDIISPSTDSTFRH